MDMCRWLFQSFTEIQNGRHRSTKIFWGRKNLFGLDVWFAWHGSLYFPWMAFKLNSKWYILTWLCVGVSESSIPLDLVYNILHRHYANIRLYDFNTLNRLSLTSKPTPKQPFKWYWNLKNETNHNIKTIQNIINSKCAPHILIRIHNIFDWIIYQN